MQQILSRDEKIVALKREFRDMDTNKDGIISHNELFYQLEQNTVT